MSPEERNLAVLCHVAAYATLLLPSLGNVLGPLIVWLIYRKQYPEVDRHGLESVNFQLSMTIYTFVTTIAVGVLSLLTCGIGAILFVIPAGIMLIALILPIPAALAASREKSFIYPFNLNLIKPETLPGV